MYLSKQCFSAVIPTQFSMTRFNVIVVQGGAGVPSFIKN